MCGASPIIVERVLPKDRANFVNVITAATVERSVDGACRYYFTAIIINYILNGQISAGVITIDPLNPRAAAKIVVRCNRTSISVVLNGISQLTRSDVIILCIIKQPAT